MKAKSDGSRFTNIVDLNAEKERFEKVQKTFDEGQTKW
ncbi:Uncharacterised protein, partial [Mycoplasmoides gallisepticum]